MITVMLLLEKVLNFTCCLSNNILKTCICPCSAGQQSGFSCSKAGTFGSQEAVRVLPGIIIYYFWMLVVHFVPEPFLGLLTFINEKVVLSWPLHWWFNFPNHYLAGPGFWSQNKLHTTDRSCKQRRGPSLSKLGAIQWHDDCEDNRRRCGRAPCVLCTPVPHGGVRSHSGWEHHRHCGSSWPRFFQQPRQVTAAPCSFYLWFYNNVL